MFQRRVLGKVPATGVTFFTMTTKPSGAALLDEAHAAFLQRDLTIDLGARDADNVATLTRALGCRVSADRRRATMFVSVRRAQPLSMDLHRLGVCMAVLLCLQGCASLCGGNSTREGVFGITLRCQTADGAANAWSERSAHGGGVSAHALNKGGFDAPLICDRNFKWHG